MATGSASVKIRIDKRRTECMTILPKVISLNRIVQCFDELHPVFKKLIVGDSSLRPAVQYGINSKTLFTAELLIDKIRVMNDLPDHSNLLVTNSKCFLQRLKRAVFTAMAEPSVKHVERHCSARNLRFWRKGEPRLFIYEISNQPR